MTGPRGFYPGDFSFKTYIMKVKIDGAAVACSEVLYPASFLEKVAKRMKELKMPDGEVPTDLVCSMVEHDASHEELEHMRAWCIEREYYESAKEFTELMIEKGFITKGG